jgi:hypothetical protein
MTMLNTNAKDKMTLYTLRHHDFRKIVVPVFYTNILKLTLLGLGLSLGLGFVFVLWL